MKVSTYTLVLTKYVRKKYCYICRYYKNAREIAGKSIAQKYEILIYGKRKSHHPEIADPGRIVSIERERNMYTEIHDFYFSNVLHSKNDILELASFFRRPRECFTLPLYVSLLLSLLLSFIHPFLLVIIIYRYNF